MACLANDKMTPGYSTQDKLEAALDAKFSRETLDANLQHARHVSRTEGIDKMLKEYDIDVIIGPAESAMTSFAAASGTYLSNNHSFIHLSTYLPSIHTSIHSISNSLYSS